MSSGTQEKAQREIGLSFSIVIVIIVTQNKVRNIHSVSRLLFPSTFSVCSQFHFTVFQRSIRRMFYAQRFFSACSCPLLFADDEVWMYRCRWEPQKRKNIDEP